MFAGNEGASREARTMAQLTVREARDEMIGAHGRSAGAEHRNMSTALFGAGEDFAARAEALRRRLRSSVDSVETIRADRDRDGAAA